MQAPQSGFPLCRSAESEAAMKLPDAFADGGVQIPSPNPRWKQANIGLVRTRGKTASYELFFRFVRAVDVEPADFSG
jgi:hypothetical protein